MGIQNTPYSYSLVLTLSFFVISNVFIYLQRPFKNRIWSIPIFIILAGCITWIAGNFLELIFINKNIKIFFYCFQNLGIMLIPLSWFVFSLLYTGYNKWVNLRNIIILAIIPFTTAVLIFTNRFHNLIVTNYEVLNYDSFIVLDKSFGFWQKWVDLPYSILLGIFAAFFILKSVLKKNTIYKWQAAAFLIAALIPLFTGILNILYIDPIPFLELTPILMGTCLILIIILLSRTRIGEILPLARENVINNISDGFIILDRDNIIIDINNKATKILDKSENELKGKNFFSIFPELTNKDNVFNIAGEIDFVENSIKSTFEINTLQIYNFYKKAVGKSITFHDITERKKSDEIQNDIFDATISIIIKLSELSDPITSGHQEKVAKLSLKIAEEFGFSKEEKRILNIASLIHDIGKITIPAEILSKPGILNGMEMEMMKTHSDVGYSILKDYKFPWPIAKIILQHHERIDGSGYPMGLKGTDIMMEARIIAVADVMEAMLSHRTYRPATSIKQAIKEISKNSGILYDENVVKAVINIFENKKFQF
jgi:putative nucleotidyltransferase with HDIG domain/PAS domain S-box-containing protein